MSLFDDRLNDLEGLVPPEVCEELYHAAHAVPERLAVVEIGSFKGKSTCCLAAGAKSGRGAHVWAVDPWTLPGNATGRFGFAAEETRKRFHEQVEEMDLTEQVTAIQGFSVEVAAVWTGPPVSLLYVDGDHSYTSVISDFGAWRQHLVSDATIIFDDLDTERNPGVRRAVDRLSLDRTISYEQRGRLAVAKCLL